MKEEKKITKAVKIMVKEDRRRRGQMMWKKLKKKRKEMA